MVILAIILALIYIVVGTALAIFYAIKEQDSDMVNPEKSYFWIFILFWPVTLVAWIFLTYFIPTMKDLIYYPVIRYSIRKELEEHDEKYIKTNAHKILYPYCRSVACSNCLLEKRGTCKNYDNIETLKAMYDIAELDYPEWLK